MQTIAIIGATGAVGTQIIELLEKRNFPCKSLRCFASPKSIGKNISFRKDKIPTELLSKDIFSQIDLAFFAAGSALSKEWIPEALKTNTLCIDLSSAYRMDPLVPLIIPEINANILDATDRLIASPNCAATILLLPLTPLHRKYHTKRIVLSTYQAASGGGAWLLNHLLEETKSFLNKAPAQNYFPYPYAFNLFPHTSLVHPSFYVDEEIKILEESKKILMDPNLKITATCVRVPVLRAHSLSANVEFSLPFDLKEVISELKQTPGVTILEDWEKNKFPTPRDAEYKNDVFCGRIRRDASQPNTLEFWAVGDQLLKGAALNAVQIAEFINSKFKL